MMALLVLMLAFSEAEMCKDITPSLRESVERGEIISQEAKDILSRCEERYG